CDKIRCISICARNNKGWNVHYIGSQTCSNEFVDRLTCWHQYFPTHMSAFLCRRQLVFKMNSSCTCFDHGLHELKSIQVSAESSLSVRDDGSHPVNVFFTAETLDLICAQECVVDFSHD